MLAANGKIVSERHAEAEANGLLTAGQVAKLLRKKGFEIKAKELKDYADEWHHSGFYKGSGGSTMGRTYFFSPDTDLANLQSRIEAGRQVAACLEATPKRTVYKFSVKFEKRYDGQYGRKRWQPLARFEVFEAPESETFSDEISAADYELIKSFEGKELETYESFEHFKKRMLI